MCRYKTILKADEFGVCPGKDFAHGTDRRIKPGAVAARRKNTHTFTHKKLLFLFLVFIFGRLVFTNAHT